MTETDTTPWYKQFWPWFIIALPASVVVAGFITLYIAIVNDDSMVKDDYYKAGMGINRELKADKRAEELGLSASVKIDPLIGEVWGELTGLNDEQMPSSLTLLMLHPTTAEKDFQASLTHQGKGRYRGDLSNRPVGRWYLQLTGDQPEPWRLRGEAQIKDVISIPMQY